jgi:hypothetical protein
MFFRCLFSSNKGQKKGHVSKNLWQYLDFEVFNTDAGVANTDFGVLNTDFLVLAKKWTSQKKLKKIWEFFVDFSFLKLLENCAIINFWFLT